MLERLKTPMQDLSDLFKETKKRGEDIKEAYEDLQEKIYDEDWDEDHLYSYADNWDEFIDLVKEIEELEKDMLEIALDNDEDLSEILSYGKGGVKADAEKMCDMICDAEEFMKKAQKDLTNTELMTEANKMATDNEATTNELKEKYKDDEDGKKALLAELAKCKCD